MSEIGQRFRQTIARFGEPVSVGGTTRRAIVCAREPRETHRAAFVPSDEPLRAGDRFFWGGVGHEVAKVVEVRFRDEAVVRVLVLR
ncbi:MAG: hypothetical protein KIS66_05660 [Fimbriimonadaceae bacterium]|nr:hypothetical protein [Fimbriimonadaceae bacterium]